MTDYIQVVITAEKKEDVERIVRAALEARLIACGQVLGPIESTYWWKGRLESAAEWICFMKSRKDLFPDLRDVIEEIHPYETPEIVAMPIVAAAQGYLDWLAAELK